MSNDKKRHEGLLIAAAIENDRLEIKRVEPTCIEHNADERCAVGICDEAVYESPDAPAVSSVGYRPHPRLAANWERTFGKKRELN